MTATAPVRNSISDAHNLSSTMQVHENFGVETETPYTENRTYTISRTSLLLLTAVFLCSIVAACFIVYNFAACPAILPIEQTICEHHNVMPLLPVHVNDVSDETTFSRDKQTVAVVDTDLRLPRSMAPISYNIQLIPFLIENNFTFDGIVNILINVTEYTNNITLHAVGLNIRNDHVSVKFMRKASHEPIKIDKNKKIDKTDKNYILNQINRMKNHDENNTTDKSGASDEMHITKQYLNDLKQFYIIEFTEELQAGSIYEIRIRYSGVLNDFLQGFYKSSYNVGNETRWVAATQFQPTDARRAFPCFDEPALKARFNLTLARPKNMSTLSNMPKLEESKPVDGMDDYVWDTYQESVPMSTYLLAFVVSDFVNRTSGRFTVWARADAIRSAGYALEIGPKLLSFLEGFFGIDYPLPKVDMIALPDFTAGAMENWGLITFREAAMLYEEGVSARINKQRVATVIAHELAHQWFGNLVTPDWWSDLWLNEGFASYMEYVCVDAVEPTWKTMDQFVVLELEGVFTLDALSSSHKIWIEVQNPEEINEIFDRISYGKGATIIRMMDHFITPSVFKEGLKHFLNTKAYQATSQEDLWTFLTDTARKNKIFDNSTSVKEIMDTWTLQTGFPVVSVTRNYEEENVLFSQERFVYNNDTIKMHSDESPPNWFIPISYTTSDQLNFDNTKPTHWIRRTPELTIDKLDISNSSWFIVNVQQTGYYRVNYDQNNWNLIIDYLRDNKTYHKIAPSNRAQLIDDSLNLARGGYLSYQTAMDVTQYLKHESDYVPWKAAISAMNFIDSMMIKRGEYHTFKKYFLSLIEKIYADIGFEDTKDSDMLTVCKRVDILTAACHLGHEDCVDKSYSIFRLWMLDPSPNNNNPISPNIRGVVYCAAIKEGDQQEWDFAWDRFQQASVSSEKELLLSALGCSRETWILVRYLERSLSDTHGIRKHDVFRVFAAVSSNVIGQPIAFNYIRNNWKRMKEYLGSSFANLNAIVKFCTKRLNNKYELDEFKRFSILHLKDGGRTIQQAIETTETNIAWMDRNFDTIVDWLKNVTYDS